MPAGRTSIRLSGLLQTQVGLILSLPPHLGPVCSAQLYLCWPNSYSAIERFIPQLSRHTLHGGTRWWGGDEKQIRLEAPRHASALTCGWETLGPPVPGLTPRCCPQAGSQAAHIKAGSRLPAADTPSEPPCEAAQPQAVLETPDPLLTAHISASRRSLATRLRSKGADIHPPLGRREEQEWEGGRMGRAAPVPCLQILQPLAGREGDMQVGYTAKPGWGA